MIPRKNTDNNARGWWWWGQHRRKQIKFPTDQMYSPWKISNHPNSQTSLQKLLGKSFVPCHITHIYQDAAQPLHPRVYQIICSHNGRKGTHYSPGRLRRSCSRAIFREAAAKQKQIMVNIRQSSAERYQDGWPYPDSLSVRTDVPESPWLVRWTAL